MWNDTKNFQSVNYTIAQPAPATPAQAPVKPASPTPAKERSKVCEKPTIKGNKNSRIYHIHGGQSYDKTTANIEWFCSEADAQKPIMPDRCVPENEGIHTKKPLLF